MHAHALSGKPVLGPFAHKDWRTSVKDACFFIAQMDLFPSPPRGRSLSSVLTRGKALRGQAVEEAPRAGAALTSTAAVPFPVLEAAKSLALIQTAAKPTLNDADEVEVFSEDDDVASVATILHFASTANQPHVGTSDPSASLPVAHAQPAPLAVLPSQSVDDQAGADIMDADTVADGPEDGDNGFDAGTEGIGESGPVYLTTHSATPQALTYLRSHQPKRHCTLMYDGEQYTPWRKAPQRAAIALATSALQRSLGADGTRRVLRDVWSVLHSPQTGEGKQHLQAFEVQSLPSTHAAHADGSSQGLFATCDLIRGALPPGVTRSYVRVLPYYGKTTTEAQWKASSQHAQRYSWWPGGLVPREFNKLYVLSDGQTMCQAAYVNAVRLGNSVVHGTSATMEMFAVLCSAPACIGCQAPLWHFHLLYGVMKSVEAGEELLVDSYGDDYPGLDEEDTAPGGVG